MLPSLGLFKSLPCPLYPSCNRNPCFFSHTIQSPKPAPKPQQLKKPDPINKRKREEEDRVSKKVRQPPDQSKKASSSSMSRSMPTSSTSKQITPEKKSKPVSQSDQVELTKTKQRVAHKATFKASGPPLIAPNSRSAIPLKVRQTIANKIYEQYERIYLPLQRPELATEHTKTQEEDILSKITNLAGYKQLATSTLVHLKKRPVSTGDKDIGLDGEWVDPATIKDVSAELKAKAEKCICSLEQLKQLEYPLPDVFTNTLMDDLVIGRVGEEHDCDRCKSRYIIKDILDSNDVAACDYHPLRLMMTKRFGEKQRLHPCCSEPGDSKGCTKGAHVYKDTNLSVMHAKIPFVLAPSVDSSVPKCKLVALDCEMGYTTGGMELIRMTAVDEKMKVLVDELVLPINMIIDLNSAYSGVYTLKGAKHDLVSLRNELFKYIDQDTILIGHGLENDMNALRIVHTKVIDTVALYPHSAGLPFRNSLRQLASRYLKKFIQTGSDGHDSLEDARTCIELLEAYKL